jgi:DNA-binding NarL/FixJ family response regulator
MTTKLPANTQRRALGLRPLTNLEQLVAGLISHGLRNKVIALHLNMTEGAVKQHAHGIFQKLGIRKRREMTNALTGRDRSTVQ